MNRFAFWWSEDGDSVQATSDQRVADHLPPLLPPDSDVLCHHILQTLLLWGGCYCQLIHFIGHYHTVHKVTLSQLKPNPRLDSTLILMQCDGQAASNLLCPPGGHLAHIYTSLPFHWGQNTLWYKPTLNLKNPFWTLHLCLRSRPVSSNVVHFSWVGEFVSMLKIVWW